MEASDRDLAALLARGETLTGLPGVGAGIAATLAELVREDGRFLSLPGMKERKAATLKRALAARRRRREV